MKKILITFFFILIISCSQQNSYLQIHECEFILAEFFGNPFNSVDTYKKWIENKQDAMNSKIQFEDLKLNNRNLDSLYQTKAQYLFIIGGGGIWVRAKNCRAEVKNDTLFFFYKPIINNAPTGEASPTMMCLEIDKIKYPNYRNLKIKYVNE
jgi:hypothetical protein